MKTLCGLILSLVFISCSQQSLQNSQQDKKPVKGLLKSEGLKRSHVISKLHYDLDIDIRDRKLYSGLAKAHFNLSDKVQSLRVDFFKGSVQEVLVNNKKVSDFTYNDQAIIISGSVFVKGHNTYSIKYNHKYSNTGEGFHQFKDPKDGHHYLYTDFEPFKANQLFPNFDQPDLKATYELQVKAPKGWTVITSVKESKVYKKSHYSLWKFNKSERFSTYVFSLHAGPYYSWNSSYNNIKLKLYSRKSLAKHVNHKEWFLVTKQGFKYFEEYFGKKYPYSKYDQILVPDFNWGGMENVGAVTYNEIYIHKSKPTISQRERRANVILHELAHMWFGNLVTMKWWNGLWLNESFATIMANKGLYEATEFKDAWQTFYGRTKGWAYWTDQLVTTHPIEVPVNDTDTAFTNFDGITYGKGASVLKQLEFYLGDDFKTGIQAYFIKHAGSNTELEDFFHAMEFSSTKNLDSWVNEWILKAGLNTVEAQFSCEANKIKSFSLIQSAPKKHNTLRTHRTIVGLYKLVNGKMKLYSQQTVTYKGSKTNLSALEGLECPSAVLPNLHDKDYVKIALDKKTLSTVQKAIETNQDKFSRTIFWNSLWEMVRDAKLSLKTYVELVKEKIDYESDPKLKATLIKRAFGSANFYYTQAGKSKLRDELEVTCWEKLKKSKVGSDIQKNWFSQCVSLSSSDKSLNYLEMLLKSQRKIKGITLDQGRRWNILVQLSRYFHKNAQSLVALELKKDKSDKALSKSYAAAAIKADISNKQVWFNKIVDLNTKMKFSHLRSAMKSLFPVEQTHLRNAFSESYFSHMQKISENKTNKFLEEYVDLAPVACSKDSYNKLDKFIKNNSDLATALVKGLKIANQENQRCYRIIEKI